MWVLVRGDPGIETPGSFSSLKEGEEVRAPAPMWPGGRTLVGSTVTHSIFQLGACGEGCLRGWAGCPGHGCVSGGSEWTWSRRVAPIREQVSEQTSVSDLDQGPLAEPSLGGWGANARLSRGSQATDGHRSQAGGRARTASCPTPSPERAGLLWLLSKGASGQGKEVASQFQGHPQWCLPRGEGCGHALPARPGHRAQGWCRPG